MVFMDVLKHANTNLQLKAVERSHTVFAIKISGARVSGLPFGSADVMSLAMLIQYQPLLLLRGVLAWLKSNSPGTAQAW